MNKLYRYVPEKVNNKIELENYKLKEHLYIICDMIYRITTLRKVDTNYSNKYVDIPLYYFTDIITDKENYYKAKDYLELSGIIECDKHSSKEAGKALGYRFKNENISKLTAIEIKKETLINRIIENRKKRNNHVNSKYNVYKEHFLSTFKIDKNRALDFINDLYGKKVSELKRKIPIVDTDCFVDIRGYLKEFERITNQFNHLYMSINAISDGQLHFNCNKTNNRIDTNLTTLKSELKQFIISDYDLSQIDIVNSQPFLLSIILNKEKDSGINSDELKKYTDWTTQGMFYENFEKEFIKTTNKKITRKEIKKIMFCIFYSKNTNCKRQKAIFKNIFPTISYWIENQKSKKHNALAIKMQKFESQICIDIICKELDLEGIKYYTIHDAWIVDKEKVMITEKIIKYCFIKFHKAIPKLKCESINNITTKNEKLE